MTAGQRSGWRADAIVLALVVLWLAATAWMRPLMLPDEGRYVGVAWEMLRSGDWLTPTLNGLPFFHKPPLFYWITAGSLSLFGPHEWAARVAPLLGASLGAFALYLFVRRWTGERQARLTLVALLAQPLFYIGGQFASLDMLVAGCISAAIVLAAHAALCIEHGLPYRRALAGAYAVAAAGVLAKGLIGIVLPALVVMVWLLALRRWRVALKLVWWPGLLLFGLVAAPWFVAEQARFPDFLDYFFVVQHFKRFAAGGFNNVQPIWFYPVVLLVFSLPWLPWICRLCTRVVLADVERRPVRLLMLLWVVLVVLFFSLPQSKLLGYVLPAVPPLAALMADGYVQFAAPSRRTRQLWLAGVALTSALSVASMIVLAVRPPNSLRGIATALASRQGRGEPVYMLGKYYYDVPFYARLTQPSRVVDDWLNPDVAKHDNWRKELADAGHFAAPGAAAVLVVSGALPAALCAAPVSWVIGPASVVAQYPFLRAGEALASAHGVSLWRVQPSAADASGALRCAGAPGAGLAGRAGA
jgi:4-amino-4-deoxy-L-arabinose transferase-like glycosyltransferase